MRWDSHESPPEHVGERAIHPEHWSRPTRSTIESLGPPPEHTGIFLTIYFAMIGLHGVHVLFGILVLIWLLIPRSGRVHTRLFRFDHFAALYWHIVDLISISCSGCST